MISAMILSPREFGDGAFALIELEPYLPKDEALENVRGSVSVNSVRYTLKLQFSFIGLMAAK